MCRALVLATLLVGSSAAPALGADRARVDGETDRTAIERDVASVFAKWATAEAGIDETALLRELSGLTPDPTPELFRILDEHAIPPEWMEEGEPPALSIALLDVGYRGLLQFPITALRKHFATLTDPIAPLETRLLAIRLLGDAGSGPELRLLIDLTGLRAAEDRAPRALREELAAALAKIVARDGQAPLWLGDLFLDLHPALRASAVRALGECPSRDMLQVLVALLGRSPEVDQLVLTTIARVASGLVAPFDPGVVATVRGYLSRDDSSLIRQAALTLGKLEDFESVADLLAMLQSPDQNMQWTARESLSDITRLDFRADHAQWNAWYRREEAWWSGPAQATFGRLRHGSPAVAAEAVRLAAGHRLYRHQLARELLASFDRSEESIVVLGCDALGAVGSWTVVPDLVRLLDHSHRTVRAAAHRALVRITGQDHGAEPTGWVGIHH